MTKPRCIAYVDGFNLYCGALMAQSNSRWLDLASLVRRLRTNDDIVQVHYFTTKATRAAKRATQAEYLRALETTGIVKQHFGSHKKRTIKCRVNGCTTTGERKWTKYEEKHTDVRIALQMLNDALSDRCDVQVLITGDSDLLPAVEMVRSERPGIEVDVYVPDGARGPDYVPKFRELSQAATSAKVLPRSLILGSQFARAFRNADGTEISRPAGW